MSDWRIEFEFNREQTDAAIREIGGMDREMFTQEYYAEVVKVLTAPQRAWLKESGVRCNQGFAHRNVFEMVAVFNFESKKDAALFKLWFC